jgi:hypothetical protein
MQLSLHSVQTYLALACVFPALRPTRTHVRVISVRPEIYRTNRCSLQRTHLSPGARSMRSTSPARSSCSRMTKPSTGRSTGTSPQVRLSIRIECRCAGGLSIDGRASRHRRDRSACPPSQRRRGSRMAGGIGPRAGRGSPRYPEVSAQSALTRASRPRAARMKKPAASYSPRPLRAKYHRR